MYWTRNRLKQLGFYRSTTRAVGGKQIVNQESLPPEDPIYTPKRLISHCNKWQVMFKPPPFRSLLIVTELKWFRHTRRLCSPKHELRTRLTSCFLLSPDPHRKYHPRPFSTRWGSCFAFPALSTSCACANSRIVWIKGCNTHTYSTAPTYDHLLLDLLGVELIVSGWVQRTWNCYSCVRLKNIPHSAVWV